MSFFKNKFFIGGAALVAVSILTYNLFPIHQYDRLPASAVNNAFPNELGEKWNSADQINSKKILSIIEDSLDKSTAGGNLMKRDAHPKHHGCVMANLSVDASSLNPAHQVGVFAPTASKKYEAWVRFSNGSPDSTQADAKGDVRGMALKLINIPGSASGSQDFLFMNSKSFFIKDSKQYADFMESTEGTVSLLWFLATHGRTRNVILAAQGMKVGNPLQIDYHSATPYKLGNRAVKYKMKSCTPVEKREGVPQNPTHDFLSERLVSSLSTGEACFDLYVQVSTDTQLMPVEDSTIDWDESVSVPVKIGRLTIPKQKDFNNASQRKFCENLSFDPWHTLPEQRPLGNINRIRQEVYSAISRKRHAYNNIPQIEPKDLLACTGETEVLCH